MIILSNLNLNELPSVPLIDDLNRGQFFLVIYLKMLISNSYYICTYVYVFEQHYKLRIKLSNQLLQILYDPPLRDGQSRDAENTV